MKKIVGRNTPDVNLDFIRTVEFGKAIIKAFEQNADITIYEQVSDNAFKEIVFIESLDELINWYRGELK